MGHVLLRAVKDTFEVVPPETALLRNTIADNAGNLIFSMAAQRVLTTAATDVTADRFVIRPGDADRINERYDAYVLPLANAFRISYEPTLLRLTALIRRLRIPVVVLGVGTQVGVDNDTTRLAPIEAAIRGFVAAVLDHGPSIGVRGELTRDYLVGLGFRDVEVIGCPSLFMDGDRLTIRRPTGPLDASSRLALTVSPYRKAMGPIVRHHVERYPDLTYIPQDIDTLELLLWGEAVTDVALDDPRPIHPDHPLFRDDKVRFFVDPVPWIDFLATRDFAFGSRIHGTIAALMAGTPAAVLAHDSRTLELARYFDIPHRMLRDVDPATFDAADLYAEADFGPLVDGHAERFARFVGFLDRHGLDHVFRSPEPDPDWAARRAATAWPTAVTVGSRLRAGGVGGRLKRSRRQVKRLARSSVVRRLRTTLARGAVAGPRPGSGPDGTSTD
jgi:Polysaccharide pyruvyl transferase